MESTAPTTNPNQTMNTDTPLNNPAYSVELWTEVQTAFHDNSDYYAFCAVSLTFEKHWSNIDFVRACRQLANKFAESLGHQNDYDSRCCLFREVSYPSLFQFYSDNTPTNYPEDRIKLLRRAVRLDFLRWVIAGLQDGTLSPGQSDL